MDEEDPKLQEFLSVMRPRAAARGRTWANDDLPLNSSGHATKRKDATSQSNVDDAEYVDLPLTENKTMSTMRMRTYGSGEKEEEEEEEAAVVSKDGVVDDAGVSDMDYFRSRMNADLKVRYMNEKARLTMLKKQTNNHTYTYARMHIHRMMGRTMTNLKQLI